jgi:uncharacterized protein (TIGR02678 family)
MISNSQPDDPVQTGPARPLSRRARLARLREEAEPLVAEERRLALRALLNEPLLVPDVSASSAFALARRHREWLADWFAHHAGWTLVVNAEVARLRKLPAHTTDATRPAQEPRSGEAFNRTRYVLLCLGLAALERGDRQVTLGRLAENIAMALAADPAFAANGLLWSLDQQGGRRDFVHLLRLLVQLGVLRRVQGDEERLLRDRETDVLYNVNRPVLAQVIAARRSPSLVTTDGFEQRLEALLDQTRPDTPDARNRSLRTAFVARLLDDPALYYDSLDAEEQAYLDHQRPSLLGQLTEATGLHAEVRAEGLALVDLDGDCTDTGLPEEGTEGHLTLLLATWLADRLRAGDATPLAVETIRQKTARLIRQHRHHWRKEVTQRGAEIPLTELVLERLVGLALVCRDGDLIFPLPALGRFALRPEADLAPLDEAGDLPFSP